MRRHPVVFAITAYVALAIVYTWPLALHLSSGIAHDYGDPILNTWILWWSGTQAVPLTAHWWNAPAFYPATGVLAFSETLLGLAPVTAPIAALWSQVAAYNVMLLATFVLGAACAHLLGWTLTRRHDAAFLCGLAFAFAPYRLAQVPHIQVITTFWTPLCLAAMHRFTETSRPRWVVLAALSWLMQALSCGYYFFFLSVLLALWGAWFALFRWTRRQWLVAAAAWIPCILAMLPVLLGYQSILHDTYGMHRTLPEIQMFSADVASVLSASADLLAWGWLHVFDRPESQLFPGATVVALVLFGVLHARPLARGDENRTLTMLRRVTLGATVLLLAAATVPIVEGPWRFVVGGIRIVSIARADKPLTLAIVAGLAWMALLPRVRAAGRRRSPLLFYTLAALAMFVFALGPDPTLAGRPLIYQAPYGWLMHLPGFDGIRVPARFWTMATVALAAAAALGIHRTRPGIRGVALAICCVGVLVDGWPRTFEVLPAPERRPSPGGAVARLDLPMSDDLNALALYQQMFDRVPLYNGYSGYFAPHEYALELMANAHDPRLLDALTAQGPLGVVVDHRADEDGAARRFVRAWPGSRQVHDEAAWSSYLLTSRGVVEPPEVAGSPIPIASVDAIPSGPHASRATDGDLSTRWSGGVQKTFAEFTIQLERPTHVSQVVLSLGEYFSDFPVKLRIDVSPDGRSWDTAYLGDTVLQAYYAAVRHPGEIPLVFPIDRDNVRFVRLRQNGWGDHDWSIAEIALRQ